MEPHVRTIREHTEYQRTSSIGWLRATVLGGNDSIVSTDSLMLGVAAASLAQAQAVVLAIATSC